MAEERILIIKLKQKPCDSCNLIRGCAGSCILERKWYSSMTRQEAIERMAKALIRTDYPGELKSVWQRRWENPDSHLYYLTMAEAALNALLED